MCEAERRLKISAACSNRSRRSSSRAFRYSASRSSGSMAALSLFLKRNAAQLSALTLTHTVLAPCGGHLRAHFLEDLGGLTAADACDVVLVFEQGTERMVDRI